MLQRKTLISNKESVQKELDKVLKRSETQLAEKDKLLKERTMAFEAMKMEAEVQATIDGTVTAIHVAKGDRVTPGEVLVEIDG